MEYNTLAPWQEIGATGVVDDLGSLYDRFHQIKDPRKARGPRYSLVTSLVVIFLAKLSNPDTPVAMADWARNHAAELVKLLQLPRTRMPHPNTIRRVFQTILTVAEFEGLVRDYHQQQPGSGEQWAIDGKTLRGTRIPDAAPAKHVLSVYDVHAQRVVAHEVVETKENEIVAAPQARQQVCVEGKIITGEARHAQRAVAADIVAQGGDYLWVVKENQERVYQDIQRLFAPDTPLPGSGQLPTDFQRAEKVNGGHGRIEKRSLPTSALLNGYVDWPGCGQVYRLERTLTWMRRGHALKSSHEIEDGITSLTREKASAQRVLHIRRQQWLVETGLHFRRDVTFHEDATRMTKGTAGCILAMIHNLVLGLIKQAGYHNAAQGRRYFEGHMAQAFALLLMKVPRL